MSDTMIERVARALCAADGHDPEGSSLSSCGDPYWQFYRSKARAALSAMREPTEAMVESGADVKEQWGDSRLEIAAACWPAMIDAALTE